MPRRRTAIVLGILREHEAREVIKIKSMTTAEIGLNDFLAQHGVTAYETDLAELILQLGDDQPSHIVVPALHKNRQQVREIFARTMGLPDLSDDPEALTAAARQYLREKFLRVKTADLWRKFSYRGNRRRSPSSSRRATDACA